MTVYLHKCMEMPIKGYDLSSMIYWNFDNADYPGDGDEDDSSNEMLYSAALVYKSKPGTWMISCDSPNFWRDALVNTLGPLLQMLPTDRVWWADFAALLQLTDEKDIYGIVRMAYMLEMEQKTVGETVLGYHKLGYQPAQYDSEAGAKRAAAAAWLEDCGDTLENTGYETLAELFDNDVDGDYMVYFFADSWYVLVSENCE